MLATFPMEEKSSEVVLVQRNSSGIRDIYELEFVTFPVIEDPISTEDP